MRTFDLDLVPTLVAIYDHLSVSAAAQHLGMSQSAVSAALAPMRTPKIDLKLHWHRNLQRDPKNKWLREIVANLFTDESDEWRL